MKKPTPLRSILTVAALGAVALLPGCPDDQLVGTLPPGANVDVFSQVGVSDIDVLWVVDNSGSMAQEQENLGRNFDRFLSYLVQAKTDYHIAVTTTDALGDAGKLKGDPAVITPATPNPVEAFKRNVKVGINGSARESGLDAARRTFELKPAGFLREKAHLFVIFVSDEEDNSEPGTPKFFYRYFEGLKGKGNEGMVTAGAIIGDLPDGCISDAGRAAPGTRYKEVVDKVGGRIGSICNAQFDEILRDMGIDAVGLKRKFPLTKIPDIDATDFVINLTMPCDTPADVLTALCLEKPPACGGSVSDLKCEARRKPADGPDGWSYEPATNTLVFNGLALPPKSSNLEVVYFEPGASR